VGAAPGSCICTFIFICVCICTAQQGCAFTGCLHHVYFHVQHTTCCNLQWAWQQQVAQCPCCKPGAFPLPPPPPHTTHKHSSYPHSPTHPQELEQALAAAQAHAIQEVARLERAWAGVQEEGVSRGAEAAARLQRILDLEAALRGAR
jgi:hypothetical protein